MADPEFPMGAWTRLGGGHGPPMRALFGENICENERIGSRTGNVCQKFWCVDPPLQCYALFSIHVTNHWAQGTRKMSECWNDSMVEACVL